VVSGYSSSVELSANDSLFAGVGEICDIAMREARADGAALAVLSRSAQSRELIYATDGLAQQLDELQYTIGEGPCFDAYLDNNPQFHPDLNSTSQASRWPTFAADSIQLGARALFAFPIPDGQQPMGVLELYRRSAGTLDAAECAAVQECTATIAHQLATNWEHHVARFGDVQKALDAAATDDLAPNQAANPFTRTQIHIAGGMVAVQLGIEAREGVDRLRAYSYACGRRISEVAADMIARRLTLQA
jgi:GAF domain